MTFPVAGSRPRGKTTEEDRRMESELLQDEKELAEHNMLVDLGRNDLGKISKFESVEVTEYMMVHKYSKIMHICSRWKEISGKTGMLLTLLRQFFRQEPFPERLKSGPARLLKNWKRHPGAFKEAF